MKYIGIDLHKQYFVAAVMNEQGAMLRKDRVSTDRQSIGRYFDEIRDEEGVEAVIEACYNWGYFFDEVSSRVDVLKMAHPLKTRAIAEARIKTDAIDAGVLAHLLRADLIAEAYAPSFETRDKKHLIRARASLVKMKTMLKCKIHAILDQNHIEDVDYKKMSDKFGKRGRQYIRGAQLRGNDTELTGHYLDMVEALEKKIRGIEKKIHETFVRDTISGYIETVPGIGELLAVLIRYEIDDISRFSDAKKLCSYAGLVPSTYSSGGKTRQGSITKQGNKWLRWALTEAAQRAIVRDPWLRQHHRKIAIRAGVKKANIAIARRLLEIIYKVWKEKRPYYEKPMAVALNVS